MARLADSGPDWLPWPKETRSRRIGKLGAYPPDGATAAQWAWEFLRRNPNYQADYKTYSNIPDCKLWETLPVNTWAVTSPPAEPNETISQWEVRVRREGHVSPRDTALAAYLAGKWGLLLGLADPAESEPPCFSTTGAITTIRRSGAAIDARQQGVPWPREHSVYFVFDLRASFDEQAAAARQRFDAERQHAGYPPIKGSRDKGVRRCQLMAMDSASRGAPLARAVTIIKASGLAGRGVTTGTVKKWREDGAKMADSGYKKIAKIRSHPAL